MRKNTNKVIGNDFEDKVAEYLHQKGYWVHLMQQNKSGQPADIIAVRDNDKLMIDAKHCQEKRFVLNRVEYNQISSMKKFIKLTNGSCYFAFGFEDEDRIYFVRYEDIVAVLEVSSVNKDWIKNHEVYVC